MPIYCYACPVCGHHCEVLRPIIERNARTLCPKCEAVMARDMQGETPHTDLGFETIWSEALGVHQSQVAEHRRIHPDIPIRDDGCVGISSYRENVRICKKLGFDPK